MMKFIHAGLNLLALTFAVIAMVAVFDFHNAAKIPNMYSLHSWLGLAAVILYSLQVKSLFSNIDLQQQTKIYMLFCSNVQHRSRLQPAA